jgi:hypothetical protein
MGTVKVGTQKVILENITLGQIEWSWENLEITERTSVYLIAIKLNIDLTRILHSNRCVNNSMKQLNLEFLFLILITPKTNRLVRLKTYLI